ncbi:hypothetical protein OG455_31715 [Kitasatospora sp. NBC_01287]|uniref:hypothetical protein n=1 Tax=Kitasatospora sp. NBC_01287 TaxID=2903573 RepID=UPI00225292BD|nr:hypothetical protein [Kitasatospora sp. NBC_01287]MCX4750034.1 hypothetical protein [Kitasatospora sp. NBC_01287]
MGILRRRGPARAVTAPDEADQRLAELTAELARLEGPQGLEHPAGVPPADDVDQRQRVVRARDALLGLGRSLARGRAARGAATARRTLTDRLMATAPRIPVRDLAALRRQHPGATSPEQLADRLVVGACRATTAIGAGVGAAAVVPTAAVTAELAAELLAVAAVEVKLIAELHEAYGQPAAGGARERATAYLGAWAHRRGIDSISLLKPSGVLAMGAGARVRKQVTRRLARGSLRKLPSLTPLLIGSAFGAQLNRRDTRRLAIQVRADLRDRPPRTSGFWEAAVPPS